MKSYGPFAKGEYVVHETYGVGQSCGVDPKKDWLVVQFSNVRINFPLVNIGRLYRYDGKPKALSTVGSWKKALAKAREQADEDALALVEHYAQRAITPGHAFSAPNDVYESFAAAFPYEETAGQSAAIRDVENDMRSPEPMNRLVTGDVGFGKTEVAARAAALAVLHGKQVAFLAPTQVLAKQHFESFTDRFKHLPNVKIVRLVGGTKDEALLSAVREEADIIVGTHAIFESRVVYRDLGLLIVDEEQKFGVEAKERLTRDWPALDFLLMTATPIPRTAVRARGGIMDESKIVTVPPGRKGIQTFITRKDDAGVIQHALRVELERDGQVYFLHNRVQDIGAVAERVRQLVPEATVIVGHGKMPKGEQEDVMRMFADNEADVLVCTTIIEAGVNIQNANTIIIDDAHKFNISQLHQLRGRVGRGKVLGYCYLLVPDNLQSYVEQKLDKLAREPAQGGGAAVARHDLAIRGAGELLGTRQSGHGSEIGLALYNKLVAEAVAKFSGKPLPVEPEIKVQAAVDIPATYMPDSVARWQFQVRMSAVRNEQALGEILTEMHNEYGELPAEGVTAVDVTRIRLRAAQLGVAKVTQTEDRVVFEFSPDAVIDPNAIMALTQSNNRFKIVGEHGLAYTYDTLTKRKPLKAASAALNKLLEIHGKSEWTA